MLYARINRDTKEVVEFPLSEKELRERFSSTTLPKIIDDWSLLGTDYVTVPAGYTDLKPTSTHRIGSIGASYDAEKDTYVREYGLVEIPVDLRSIRTKNRWNYLKMMRNKALRRYDILVSRHLSELRQGLTPTIDIEELDAFAQKLRDMTKTYVTPYSIDEKTFFTVPEPEEVPFGS